MEENISFSTIFSFVEHYTRELFFAGLLLAGVGYGIYHYNQSRSLKEQTATSSLLEVFEELERAYSTSGDWKEVEIAAKTGSQVYNNTLLAPYFKIAEAQALAQQGLLPEAVDLLEKAVVAIPSDVSLRYLLMTTQAQILMDSQDQMMQAQGVEKLTALSQDPKNIYKDKSLYYLLQYYQSQGNTQQAEVIASQLQDPALNDKEASPWAKLASTEQS